MVSHDGENGLSEPKRPSQVSEYTQVCLDALAASDLGRHLSLGGAFGLAHYFEYRSTNDVDAWWVEPVTREERQQVAHILEDALRPFGQVRTRAWGDVVSIELSQEKKAVFSFQIAHRSAQLRNLLPSPWPGSIYLDAFDDLVASKMVALVERGSPRDFRDIYTLCERGWSDEYRCWSLWQERQRQADEDAGRNRAVLAIRTHLARLEQYRPLNQIADSQQRLAAERLRTWFREEFLRDLA